ncbi:MAG: sugar transferase [Abditibacteriales bacterium]|nr:sugar transferase [Abditibacteriales bacterium]MDW8367588.1 sugar transferase [Abditibacteriales bacterium]
MNRVVSSPYSHSVLKRAGDLIGAMGLLIVCLPLFLVLAILIKLDSPQSPVFFCQRRVGWRGKPFTMWKFRTMHVGAEHLKETLRPFSVVTAPAFKMPNDPRVTRIGRWLRRWSLDELPQLWNVLQGTMSLVGPRPLPVEEVRLEEEVHWQRCQVKPGLTGLWQVSGRAALPLEQWFALDLEYVAKASLWLDIKILLKTPIVVISGRGAY